MSKQSSPIAHPSPTIRSSATNYVRLCASNERPFPRRLVNTSRRPSHVIYRARDYCNMDGV